MAGGILVGRVGFEPTITGARDQYLRPSCPHIKGGLDHRPIKGANLDEEDKGSNEVEKKKRFRLYFAVLARGFRGGICGSSSSFST